MRSGMSRTSFTVKLVAVSLNWNRTMCVVYGISGAWLPKRDTDHCAIEFEKTSRLATQRTIVRAPNAFLGISILVDRGSLLLRKDVWVARVLCGEIAGKLESAVLRLHFDV